jgi:hypothetical protein
MLKEEKNRWTFEGSKNKHLEHWSVGFIFLKLALLFLCQKVEIGLKFYLFLPGLSSLGVPGVPWHPQILVDQLTLSQPRGADYTLQIILAPPDFQTFRRPCLLTTSYNTQINQLWVFRSKTRVTNIILNEKIKSSNIIFDVKMTVDMYLIFEKSILKNQFWKIKFDELDF